MFNFDCITDEGIKKHNPNWPYIPDHPYRIIMVEDSGSRKTNALEIQLYAKDPYDTKYES